MPAPMMMASWSSATCGADIWSPDPLYASTPKLATGQRGALRQRLQLGPGDIGMDTPAKATVGRGDHPLAAHDVGEAQDPLRHQLRVLDDIGGMADHTGQHQLVVRQADLLPQLPLMLMADVASFQ